MLKLIATFALTASLAGSVLAQPLPTSADHTRILNEVVVANQASHLPVKSGHWSDPAVWQHHVVPKQGDTVLIPEGFNVTISGLASALWCRIEGKLSFDSKAESLFRVETLVVDMPGDLEIGTPGKPIEKRAIIEFIDNGPIKDWAQLGRGLLVMGDLSVCGKETTSFVHVANNPRKGDTQIVLSAVPKNWTAGGVVVVPGVRPALSVPEGKRSPFGPEGRDPIFKKQHELRTIAAINGSTITLNTPLEFDLHHQTDGVNIPIGYLSRNVVFHSQSNATSRRGHIMVMPTERHEYTIANAEFVGLGRTSQELYITDPRKADDSVISATVANPRGRYALHFHKMGFASRATVRGCSVHDGLKWGIVNHSSHVDMVDCIAYDVRGASFATEIGNEAGRIEGCLSICNLGFGDLNESPARRGRQAKKGRPDGTAEEKAIASLGGDFGFNGSGFWLQGSRVRLTGNAAYGCAAVGINVQTIPFGTDHLGRPTAIYMDDLTTFERLALGITDRKLKKINCNNYPLRVEQCTVVGAECGLNNWINPVPASFGGTHIAGLTCRNVGRAVEAGECGQIEIARGDFVNVPAAMNNRPQGPATDLYNRVDIVFRDMVAKGFNVAIDTVHNGSTKIIGANTRLDCITNIKVADGIQELSIELGEENFATPGGRNIAFDGAVTRPVFWRRPGKPSLKVVQTGTPGGVAMPGLVKCVAVKGVTAK